MYTLIYTYINVIIYTLEKIKNYILDIKYFITNLYNFFYFISIVYSV